MVSSQRKGRKVSAFTSLLICIHSPIKYDEVGCKEEHASLGFHALGCVQSLRGNSQLGLRDDLDFRKIMPISAIQEAQPQLREGKDAAKSNIGKKTGLQFLSCKLFFLLLKWGLFQIERS